MSAATTGRPSAFPKLARFDVVRPLGQGAAGLVFEAIDRARNERVAIKTLRSLDAESLLQLKAEFRAVQDLEHPNLIRLNELVRDGDTWFFTMELVDGHSFRAYVRGEADAGLLHSTMQSGETGRIHDAEPPVSRDRVARFDEARLRGGITQLARGLSALHAVGKVHRDIKPSNVLVTLAGRVVILDLGLAREASEASEEFVVGTALYMAPEQIAGDDVDPACDWYSVGVVLYLCLTGQHPFEGSAQDVMMRKLDEDPLPPSARVDGVPADLEELCMALLQRDPAARPSGADVLVRLTASRPSAAPRRMAQRTGQRPFVGRRVEFESLASAFADARAQKTVTVIVEGESGVGKSALVRRFTRSLPGVVHDLLLLSGRCYEREAVPYKAVDGLIDALSAHLDTLPEEEALSLLPRDIGLLTQTFPVLERARRGTSNAPIDPGAKDNRARLFAAVRELFRNLAERHPLVLVIDDLQWADADSLLLLHEVLRMPGSPPMLLLATARAERPEAGGSRTFGLPGDVRTIPVPRLTENEGLELTRLLLGSSKALGDPKMAAMIALEAGGHPLFVDELVRHAQTTGGEALAIGALDDALRARAAQLDPEPRTLLEVLAVAGVALRQETAMHAASLGFADFSRHLKTLRVGHLARSGGARGDDQVETYHDRVREAVSGRIEPARRREIHEQLARALELDPKQDPDALATHWLAAGDTARALTFTLKAAGQAYRALAFDRAAQLYRSALALPSIGAAEKLEASVRLGDALGNIGRGVDAARAFADAAALAPIEDALDLRRRGAEQLLNAGRFDEGDAALSSVLKAVKIRFPRTPIGALVGLLIARFLLFLRGLRYTERAEADLPRADLIRMDACAGVAELLGIVDTIRASHFQSRTLLLALRAGEPARLARALAMEALFQSSAGAGNARRAAHVFVEANLIADRLSHAHTRGSVTAAEAFGAFLQGSFPEAIRISETSGAILREQATGTFWHLRMTQLIPIWSLAWMGELGELARRVEQRAREADARGDLYAATCLRVGPPTIASLRGDDPVGARSVVEQAMLSWTQRGYHNQHYWRLLANAQIDLYEGNGDAAYARVVQEWPLMKRSLMFEVQIIRIEAAFLRARAALARAVKASPEVRSAMLASAARDGRTLSRSGAAYGASLADLVHAAIASLGGRTDLARPLMKRAIAGFDRAGMRLHANATRWRLGRAIGGAEGTALVEVAETWMRGEGVLNVPRMVQMAAPGFDVPEGAAARLT
jgi:serine/threonine protein kinase